MAPAPMLPRNHQEWAGATLDIVTYTKDRAQEVNEILDTLEQKEADRIAEKLAERMRQEARAARAALRRQREAEKAAEEEMKRQKASEAQQKRELALSLKRDEVAAVKAATANFHRMAKMEKAVRDKAAAMDALGQALKKMNSAILKTQTTRSMMFSALMVCEMRLQKRSEKPNQESFRDHVQDALEKELLLINSSRGELNELVEAGQRVAQQIKKLLVLFTTSPSRENVEKRMAKTCSLPSITLTSGSPRPEDLLETAGSLLDLATKLAAQCHETITSREVECNKATAVVNARLDRRKLEIEELRRSLDRQKMETVRTISDVEKRIQALQLRALDAPETPRSKEEIDKLLMSTRERLVELTQLKLRLEEDARCKTASLKIDESCRTLTKIKAGVNVSKLNSFSTEAS